jgi:hypothetical protein
MDMRLSLGSSSASSQRSHPDPEEGHGPVARERRGGHIVDFPDNPRQRLRVTVKMAWAPEEVQQKREMLTQHALLITEEDPLGVASREEVAEIISHNFGLPGYEFHIFRSNPEPFIVIFSDRATRDIVFARGRVQDGLVDLRFHTKEADRFGERVLIPYHVKVSLEGLPHHAWSIEMAERVLGDEAVIHHVEQATRRREDFRFYSC